MIRPELFKEQWTQISPKIREVFPNLTYQDVQEINGNLDSLVTKVAEKHSLKREEILTKVSPLLSVRTEKTGAQASR